MTLPLISDAVQDFVARSFMDTQGHTVDMVGHSAFSLEAYKGGLLQESDLNQITLYPNGYGLHLVTSKAVHRSAGRLDITLENAVPDAAARSYKLAKQLVDVPFAANLALSCIEEGLLHESDIAPLVAQGPDCGIDLLSAAEEALGALLPDDQRMSRSVVGDEVYTDCVLGTSIVGDHFHIDGWSMNFFHLNLPELIEGAFVEVNVLLFKTLDALSHYGVPFHTPASYMGKDGVYSHHIGEAYEVLKDRIQTSTREEFVEFLTDLNCDEVEFEMYQFGMEGEGPHDEDTVERACALLMDMHELETTFSFRLDYSEGTTEDSRKSEMQALLFQARELIGNGSDYERLLVALSDSLETCIELADHHFPLHGQRFPGSEDEGIGLFETILVVAEDRMTQLFEEAEEGYNSCAENCGHMYIGLPLESREVVAQVTIPIIKRTNQCLAHLRQIQLSLEVTPHA